MNPIQTASEEFFRAAEMRALDPNSFEGKVALNLFHHGLFPNEVAEIMKLHLAKPNPQMEGRWKDDATRWPDAFLTIQYIHARKTAVEWMDASRPNHPLRIVLAEGMNAATAQKLAEATIARLTAK